MFFTANKFPGVNADPDAEHAIEHAQTDLDTRPHTTYLKLSFICSILYFAVVTAIKISILLMYRRIFSIDASFRRQSFAVGGVVVAFWLTATVATLTNCRPLKYNWIGLQPEEYCFNYNIFWMVTGALEVVIEIVILALPMRMVLGLQLSRKRKLSILFVFLLGALYVLLRSFSIQGRRLTSAASSLRAYCESSTATSTVVGSRPSPRLSAGPPYTSAWPSSVAVSLFCARSSPVPRPSPQPLHPLCVEATMAYADGTPRALAVSARAAERGLEMRLRSYL